jgi:C_GCAxxG_C_C family probable redox protein
MTKREEAVERFRSGLNCAQAVLATFADEYGLDEEAACRVAAGFGGGIGRTGGVCGAVTGAIMALGLMDQDSDPTDPIAKVRLQSRVYGLMQEFESRTGALDCRDLLGCDISTPEGHNQAESEDLFDIRCPELVAEAVDIVEGLR